MPRQVLRYEGSVDFRWRLALATLAGKAIRIDNIRSKDEKPGIRDYESSLLKLLEKVTNGTQVSINETGTTVRYRPGILWGGGDDGFNLSHDCGNTRTIGYFLETLVLLALFMKKPLVITLTGLTNHPNQLDTSVDIIRTITLPLVQKFGVEGEFVLKVRKRGCVPLGGGEVYFKCPVVRQLTPINWVDVGKIKRVRGLAFSARCSPQFANRFVQGARGVMNHFIPDVHIYTDYYKGKEAGLSPGWGGALAAESTSGVMVSAELTGSQHVLPEDLGQQAAQLLLDEIAHSGVVDSCHQSAALLLMAMGPEDVSRIRLSKLTPHTIHNLRLMRDILGVTFKIAPDEKTLVLSCVGVGYTNVGKRTI